MKFLPFIPTATYRIQFHKGFTFTEARALVPYLDALGISHVYASPYFRASPGSMHGYDVCDPNALNPEVGSRREYDDFVAELRRHGMGHIVDFVPNHMGIAEASNQWWMDVLENGPSSPYARFFDIDWKPLKAELADKVLLPILGDQYGRVLENGELKLVFEGGSFFLDYYERRLPIAPRTTRPLLEHALEKLRASSAAPAELESIITALSHLPERTETRAEKIAERLREKEIIKARLSRLVEETPAVGEAIDNVLANIQAGGDAHGFDALDKLITAQPYRLAYWRVAAEEINYRRFFDINNLAAIRMDLPEVFEAVHRLVFELLKSGAVMGLRIDHVDGLWDPAAYLEQLQGRYASFVERAADERPLYLLVEKILGLGEKLRGDWPIHGTTGYDFVNQVGALFVDPEAEEAFTETYSRFIGRRARFSDIVYAGKLLTMRASMSSEVNVLGHMLNRLSETNRWYRDFTLNALTTAVREVIACFPVYRTYLRPGSTPTEEDRRVIDRAIRIARRRNPAIESSMFDFLRHVLIPPPENPHPVNEAARVDFVMKFQQCTGPITAKGVEDTAFYVYNRLVALNEVGGDPGVFGATAETFHRQNKARAEQFPQALLATSTHDTKRSEDVRVRIAALSEMPLDWARAVRGWHTANRRHRTEIDGDFAPDANEEYLLYQTLIGTWPLEALHGTTHDTFVQRIRDYMLKALHEAKVNSSWIEPNAAWDTAVGEFVTKILKPARGNRFLKSFVPLAERIAELGAINALAQVVLKFTSPGVPDLYQGQETWDFSLVDPDNRRPVDYAIRQQKLAPMESEAVPAEMLEQWRDGRIKLFATTTLLRYRREQPELFAHGTYTPVASEGKFANRVVSFIREHADRRLLVIVPHLSSRVGFPPIGERWGDTRLVLESGGNWRDLFTRTTHDGVSPLHLRAALSELPFAVLAQ